MVALSTGAVQAVPAGPATQQSGVDCVYLLRVLFLRCAVLVEPLVSCTVAAYYNKPGWAATVITTTTAICQEFILHPAPVRCPALQTICRAGLTQGGTCIC